MQLNQFKLLSKQTGFRKYFKNTSWLLAEKVLRIVSGLVVGVWVARYLGPDDYGLYNYAFSFVAIFSAIASLGLDRIVVRELVKTPENTPTILGTAFGLKSLGALLSIAIIYLVLTFSENDSLTFKLVLVISFSTLFQTFNVIDFYFQSRVVSKFILFANMISLAITSIVKVVLILTNAPVIAFAAVAVLDSLILAVGFVYFFFKQSGTNPMFSWRFDMAFARLFLSDSWPLIFSGLVLMVQARIDQVMLKEIVNVKQVGHYSVALRLIEIFGFIPMMLQNSLMPSLINCKKASLKLYYDRLSDFYRLNFFFFLLTAIPFFFFGDFIVELLFGDQYEVAGMLISIMAVRILFANMGVARSTYFLIENFVKFTLWTIFVGTLVNVLLNFLWIPEWEAKGAIYASIVSFTVTIFVLDFFHKKARKNVLHMLYAMVTFFQVKLKGVQGMPKDKEA